MANRGFQWLRSRSVESRLDQTAPRAALLNIVVTLGVVIVTVYFFPAISFIGFRGGVSSVSSTFRECVTHL